jgi:hypothetical protein
MAETLTYDAGTDTVTDGEGNNLTPAEQDSLAVGEKLVNEQEGLLAGKYKDAEALEKAYLELQGKLGEQSNEEKDTPEAEKEEVLQEEPEESTENYSEGAQLINSASDEFWDNDGKLSEETLSKFNSMSTQDLVQAYMEVARNNPPDKDSEPADLTDSVVNEVKNYAGGEKAYTDMVNWASSNLDQDSIDAFDSIVNSGSVQAIKLAVNGLKSQYEAANGYEGTMVTGKAPTQNKDVFRSQAELVEAMSDRRYDNDPAYRSDVIAKLSRSGDLNFTQERFY